MTAETKVVGSHQNQAMDKGKQNWGKPPWKAEFRASSKDASLEARDKQGKPEPFASAQGKHVDVAIVGGGFAGLTAAAYVKREAPGKSVLLLEAGRIGNGTSPSQPSGASHRTGGMALAQSAAGNLPELGDVLRGYKKIVRELLGKESAGELDLRGAWEIARGEKSMEGKKIRPMKNSPIDWNDSGRLRAVKLVPGGTVNPGKVLTGLARAAVKAGVQIAESARVVGIEFGPPSRAKRPIGRSAFAGTLPVRLHVKFSRRGKILEKTITADRVLLATNAGAMHVGKTPETVTQRAQRSEHREHREERRAQLGRLNYEVLGGAAGSGSGPYRGLAGPRLTFAVATEPLTKEQIAAIGMQSGRPFYTVDVPYLWGRLLPAKSSGAKTKSAKRGMIFGSGLVPGFGEKLRDAKQGKGGAKHLWSGLEQEDVGRGEPRLRLKSLEQRVRALHPALKKVRFTHRWGGPILITADFVPVFRAHPKSKNVIVLGGFSGHGVAQSVYLGRWAAEAMLGKRKLPQWSKK